MTWELKRKIQKSSNKQHYGALISSSRFSYCWCLPSLVLAYLISKGTLLIFSCVATGEKGCRWQRLYMLF